eukprot:6910335-Ditylum_brightwellii.AAC.1
MAVIILLPVNPGGRIFLVCAMYSFAADYLTSWVRKSVLSTIPRDVWEDISGYCVPIFYCEHRALVKAIGHSNVLAKGFHQVIKASQLFIIFDVQFKVVNTQEM